MTIFQLVISSRYHQVEEVIYTGTDLKETIKAEEIVEKLINERNNDDDWEVNLVEFESDTIDYSSIDYFLS